MESKENLLDINDFNYIKEIGKGSYSIILLIEKKDTGELYAAKLLGPKNDTNEKYINNEIKIMSQFPHQIIMPFEGFALKDFDGKDNVIIIMKYFQRGSIDKYINEYTKRMIQQILAGIAFGMMHLHKHNIIHRDLKPENILIDDRCRPIISDFGISKFFEKEEIDQTFGKYTPKYCAPEALSLAKYSTKSDVYSYSILMFQLITKQDPYPDIKNQFQMFKSIEERRRPIFPPDIKIEPEIKNLIIQCWSNDPDKRPSFEEIFNKFCVIFPKNDYIQELKNGLNPVKIDKPIIKTIVKAETTPKPIKLSEEIKYDKRIKDLERDFEELLLNCSPEKTKNEFNQKFNSLKKENKLLKDQITELEKSIKKMQDIVKNQKNNTEEYIQNEINKSLKNNEDEFNRRMKIKDENFNKKINSLKNENDLLRSQFSDLENKMKNQIKQYEDQITQLHSDIENIHNVKATEKSNTEQTIKNEIKKNNKTQEEEINKKINSLKDQITEKIKQITQLQSDIEDIHNIMATEKSNTEQKIKNQDKEINKKINSLKDQISNQESQITEIEKSIKKMQDIAKNQKNNTEEYIQNEINKSLKNNEDEFNRKMKVKDKKINSLKNENNLLRSQFSDLENKMENQIKQFSDLKLNIQNEVKINNNAQEEEINKKINSLKDQITEKIKQITQLQSDIEDIHNTMATKKSNTEQNIKNEIKKNNKTQEEEINKKIKSFKDQITEQQVLINEDFLIKNAIQQSKFEQNIKTELEKFDKCLFDISKQNSKFEYETKSQLIYYEQSIKKIKSQISIQEEENKHCDNKDRNLQDKKEEQNHDKEEENDKQYNDEEEEKEEEQNHDKEEDNDKQDNDEEEDEEQNHDKEEDNDKQDNDDEEEEDEEQNHDKKEDNDKDKEEDDDKQDNEEEEQNHDKKDDDGCKKKIKNKRIRAKKGKNKTKRKSCPKNQKNKSRGRHPE